MERVASGVGVVVECDSCITWKGKYRIRRLARGRGVIFSKQTILPRRVRALHAA